LPVGFHKIAKTLFPPCFFVVHVLRILFRIVLAFAFRFM
jgi:hypothetical protein